MTIGAVYALVCGVAVMIVGGFSRINSKQDKIIKLLEGKTDAQ